MSGNTARTNNASDSRMCITSASVLSMRCQQRQEHGAATRHDFLDDEAQTMQMSDPRSRLSGSWQ